MNTQRSKAQILHEIEERFGFVPPFFLEAKSVQVLDMLWQQTVSTYLDNPLPALYKEQLFAYLSRYCDKPYCLVCHSCYLYPLGLTSRQILELVSEPPPGPLEVKALLDEITLLEIHAWPQDDPKFDRLVLRLSVVLYLKGPNREAVQLALARLLGSDFEYVIVFLGYVRACALWIDAHPKLSYDADQRAQSLEKLSAEEPLLSVFFRNHRKIVSGERRAKTARPEPARPEPKTAGSRLPVMKEAEPS